jgi:hypothetical protein
MQSCILCLEEGANLKQLNHCGIYYIHKQCHSKWISKNNTCIVCREPLVNEHTIIVQQVQQVQQVNQEVERYSNYRIINRIQFKMVYTINVMLIVVITVLIYYIW